MWNAAKLHSLLIGFSLFYFWLHLLVSDFVNEYKVLVGNQKWMMENSVFVSENLLQIIDEFESRQETAVLVAVDGKVVAIISISDPIKPEARIAIQVNFIF